MALWYLAGWRIREINDTAQENLADRPAAVRERSGQLRVSLQDSLRDRLESSIVHGGPAKKEPSHPTTWSAGVLIVVKKVSAEVLGEIAATTSLSVRELARGLRSRSSLANLASS